MFLKISLLFDVSAVRCGASVQLRVYRAGLANFWRRMPRFSINFEKILSLARENFEEQNKFLDFP